MSINHHDNPSTPEEPSETVGKIQAVSPGKLLREAREARQLTQEEIASRLNLRVQVIRDIEQDHFDAKLSETFHKGYLRSYARALQIPEDQVLSGYVRGGDGRHEEMQSFSRRLKRETHDNRLMMVSYLVGAVIIVMLVIWWYQEQKLQQLPAEAQLNELKVDAEDEAENPPELASELVAPSEPISPLEMEVQQPSLPEVQVEPLTDVAAEGADEIKLEPTAESEPLQPEKSVIDRELVMTFTDVSWIKVTDSQEKRLAIGEKGPGQSLTLSGEPPYQIVIGVPSAVQLSFAGKGVDLSRFSGKIARIQLPE